MYGIIYKATNTLNGKVYIGLTTKTLKTRKVQHKFMAKKGDKRTPFQAALLDKGFNNFVWSEIDQAETKEGLSEKEIYWIGFYNSMNPEKGYNNTIGGIKTVYSEETRRKIGEASKNRSPETYRKISEANKGHIPWNKGKTGVYSKETRQKNSEAHKGLQRGEKNARAKLTEATVLQIKIDIQSGMRVCEIARKYGVKDYIVQNIKSGSNWAWLTIQTTA
jgi:group I intron endonuclease